MPHILGQATVCSPVKEYRCSCPCGEQSGPLGLDGAMRWGATHRCHLDWPTKVWSCVCPCGERSGDLDLDGVMRWGAAHRCPC